MKKISTLFKKDPNDLGRVINEVDPQNQWVIDGMAIATRKWDGSACAIINGELYKRYDAKKGKKAPEGIIDHPVITEELGPCQELKSILFGESYGWRGSIPIHMGTEFTDALIGQNTSIVPQTELVQPEGENINSDTIVHIENLTPSEVLERYGEYLTKEQIEALKNKGESAEPLQETLEESIRKEYNLEEINSDSDNIFFKRVN